MLPIKNTNKMRNGQLASLEPECADQDDNRYANAERGEMYE